jgi:hypothetical protein
MIDDVIVGTSTIGVQLGLLTLDAEVVELDV